MVSSTELHPRHGARFVLTRVGTASAPSYRVEVYLPHGDRCVSQLSWNDAGKAVLDPTIADEWIAAEVRKLALVLRRDPKDRLSRWRARPER